MSKENGNGRLGNNLKLVMLIAAIGGVVFAGGGTYHVVQVKAEESVRRIEINENKIEELHENVTKQSMDVIEIKGDVKTIRAIVERIEKR